MRNGHFGHVEYFELLRMPLIACMTGAVGVGITHCQVTAMCQTISGKRIVACKANTVPSRPVSCDFACDFNIVRAKTTMNALAAY
jgi:hypothetical protein